MLAQHKQHILDLFGRAVEQQLATQPDLVLAKPPVLTLDRPRDPSHGDVACNIAMQLARLMKRNPRELAQALCDDVLVLAAAAGNLVVSAEVAGPGFINLRLSAESRWDVLREVAQQGADYGRLVQSNSAKPTVLIEFVSANPTGPLHVGHGRQGVLGDALSTIFEYRGYQVQREFYYNDAGVQIATLASSVQARARGEYPGSANWPESAYNGDYIADIARDFLAGKTVAATDGEPVTGTGDANDLDTIRRFGVAYLRHEQDLDLQAFGVKFDNYYLESSLYTEGRVENAVTALKAAGKTYEQDGALWLRTTEYGDDKDRVMKKSDGTYTYFVPDVAYHVSKWERGYTKAINIQGSDHHGTIARVRAGLQALDIGIMPGYPDYLLHKMVTVMRNGEEVKISKRAGSYVTLRDLIEWSSGTDERADQSMPRDLTRGRDAVRFFLVSRKPDTEFVFDVDLALAQNDENPVYYVQYAHARIHSVLRNGGIPKEQLKKASLAALTTPRELLLIDRISEFGAMLDHALGELAPHHVAFYLRELAGDFHSYYNAERVLVDDEAVKLARLALLDALAQTLHNGLAVLGVSAPERM